MNSVNLIGRLTRDPELRKTPSDTSVCTMRIAVNGIREGEVTYIDVVAFEKQAEACARHLSKGREVGVSGRLSYSEWQAEDGSKRSKHEGIGRVQFLSAGNRNGTSPESTEEPVAVGTGAASDEDIPF
jgi:single-strand DNA-binding protein